MNRTTRMMMMQNSRGNGARMGNPYREEDTDYRNEYRDNHEEVTGSMAESRRRRDSGGRYMESDYGPEMRYYSGGYDMAESEGRRMRGGGEYAEMRRGGTYTRNRGEYDRYAEAEESPEMRRASMYALPRNERPADLIGFMGREGSEMHSGKHHKQEQHMGHASGKTKPFDVEMAKEWTNAMEGEDGKRGPHFTFEEALNLMSQVRVDVEPIEFWAVLNAIYSDYCILFMELGIAKPEVYAKFAKAWLNDVDAVPDKAAAYYEHVVKHK